MTRKPNLFLVGGKYYSIHTYARANGINPRTASKRLRKMAMLGECRFVRRNNCNQIHTKIESTNQELIGA